MSWLAQISFDDLVVSALICLVIREACILALPDHLAGPGGSFINTDRG